MFLSTSATVGLTAFCCTVRSGLACGACSLSTSRFPHVLEGGVADSRNPVFVSVDYSADLPEAEAFEEDCEDHELFFLAKPLYEVGYVFSDGVLAFPIVGGLFVRHCFHECLQRRVGSVHHAVPVALDEQVWGFAPEVDGVLRRSNPVGHRALALVRTGTSLRGA